MSESLSQYGRRKAIESMESAETFRPRERSFTKNDGRWHSAGSMALIPDYWSLPDDRRERLVSSADAVVEFAQRIDAVAREIGGGLITEIPHEVILEVAASMRANG